MNIKIFESLLNLVNDKHVWNEKSKLGIQDKEGSIRYKNDSYFPTPLIGLILRQMHDLRPDEFTPLHILSRGIGGKSVTDKNAENQFTAWLPIPSSEIRNILPSEIEPEKIYIWDDPSARSTTITLPAAEKMIARYVAAMVIGKAVSFAPKEIILDYYSSCVRKYWGKLIDRAIFENGGKLMEIYSTELGCEPSIFNQIDVLKTFPVSPLSDAIQNRVDNHHIPQNITSPPCQENRELPKIFDLKKQFILGIDIGGTGIKLGKFNIDSLRGLADSITINKTIETKTIEDMRQGSIWTVHDLVNFLKTSNPEFFESDLIAIGVSLAAPVGLETGRPTGTCNVLNKLFGTEKSIAKANPIDLHKIDFETALSSIFTNKPVVKILNDGTADIKDGEDITALFGKEVKPRGTHIQEGVTVELKAGTGIAVAVYKDGSQWDISAESAKAILNLMTYPQITNPEGEILTPEERFQQGVVSNYCSKNGIKRLTDYLVFSKGKHTDAFNNPGFVIGSLLGDLLLEDLWEGKTPNESYPSPETQSGFEKNLQEFDKISECLNKLYIRAWQINQLHLAVDTGNLVHDYREALLRKLRTKFDTIKQPKLTPNAKIEPVKSYSQLTDFEKYAIGSAWVLGGWLADAIALVAEIFDAREVRLAGGPLSGATGIFVVASAEKALQDVYGYDLEVVWDTKQDGGGIFQPIPITRHRIREMKLLRLIFPPANKDSSGSGARGAAKAAFESWVIRVKQDQLLKCRDYIQKTTLPSSDKPNQKDFTPKSVLEALKAVINDELRQQQIPALISEDEIAEMLAQESAALGLTRTVEGGYCKYRS